ncbi:hypothetical protein [Treponema pedis]|uniref:hypothetical protein n=1 Tax=Treponema pedis TaxID=409322 RepID=UPI0004184E08|nr:hypothetical protein [Treponema pedis]
MKKLASIVLILFFLPLIAAADIYDDFFAFKIELYNQADAQGSKTFLEKYKTSIETMTLTEEEKLTLVNLFILEEMNTLKDENGKPESKKIYKLLTQQNTATEKFMQGKKKNAVTRWLLLSWADIKSRLTSFLSGQDMYKEAFASKELYEFVLKQNKKFSPAHISFGLWLFFAPPISGGGYDASLKEFSNAVSYAKNKNEKYYALCCRSQVYTALEQTKKAEEDLNEAHSLIQNENFTKIIIEMNNHDKLFFE